MIESQIEIDKEFLKLQSDVLKAMAHPTRLEIMQILTAGTLCVCEIVEITGGEYSNISRHLSKLARVGILESEKKGTNIYYSLACPCVINFLSCINEVIVDQESKKSRVIMKACKRIETG